MVLKDSKYLDIINNLKTYIMDKDLKRERVTILTALVVLIVGFIWGVSNKVLEKIDNK